MKIGRSIRLFLVDGSPTGLMTAEIPNWTGHILVAPRSRVPEALDRAEATKTGIYFLIGQVDSGLAVYVGEGDCIADRIRKHAKDPDKDFWERVCLVTSKDWNLTKAHVRYLESRLVQIARESGRSIVLNGNEPPSGSLPESDLSDMEFFLAQLQILLPTVGMDFLRPKLPDAVSAQGSKPLSGSPLVRPTYDGPTILVLKQKAVDGRAVENDGEIIVLKGSTGSGRHNAANSYAQLREELIRSGKIELLADGSIRFLDDVAFSSPSAAAAVLNNRNSSGPREWIVEASGQTLGNWRSAMLDNSLSD